MNRILRPLMKLFFHLLYQPFAWSYDLVAASVSAGRWKKWVLHTVPFLNGERILELGHGPGHLQVGLAVGNRMVFGVDRSGQMGRIAYQRIASSNGIPRLARASANALPFPGNHFNTVAATFPTEYISQWAAMQEIYRVLEPGGRLVVLLSAWITGGSLLDRALAKLFRVTGQTKPAISSGEGSLQRLKEVGFHAHLSWVEFETSRLLLLIAEKSAAPETA
jgi:ubiquinone/menaquinone biosynthesis C-methylase UbiE